MCKPCAGALQIAALLFSASTPWDCFCDYAHFTDKVCEAHRLEGIYSNSGREVCFPHCAINHPTWSLHVVEQTFWAGLIPWMSTETVASWHYLNLMSFLGRILNLSECGHRERVQRKIWTQSPLKHLSWNMWKIPCWTDLVSSNPWQSLPAEVLLSQLNLWESIYMHEKLGYTGFWGVVSWMITKSSPKKTKKNLLQNWLLKKKKSQKHEFILSRSGGQKSENKVQARWHSLWRP